MIITDLKKLRQRSKKFNGTKEELNELIKSLEEELANSKIPGAGLSAIQIGRPTKIAIIRLVDFKLDLYNATITTRLNPIIFKQEGCLSIPNVFKNVPRFNNVTIKNGGGRILNLTGFKAIVVQHELDHFNGILFIDRVIY